VPFFPAGFSPLNTDFDQWIQAPLSFFKTNVVFRAELSNALTLTNNVNTLVPYNVILEDPLGGWNAGSSQWLVPAGYSGVYSVTVIASCAANASTPVLSARVGINAAATLNVVDKCWVPAATVPGIASGGIPVRLFGGQDSVQGYALSAGANGAVVTTAGQRCAITIKWVST
jgi:hypothetical protein